MQLGRQSPGGIGQHDVDLACLRGLDGIKAHRRRITALLADDRHLVACAPFGQLLARSCAKGVAGCQQHAFAVSLEILGQFADGGGFAGSVDARHHDDQRAATIQVQRLF